jgi:hypothetical protein
MEVMDRDTRILLHEVTGFLRNSSEGNDQSAQIGTRGELLPFRSTCYENIYFAIERKFRALGELDRRV